ncbi:hypothetical protein [Methylocapsa aurea]|uniref:hypothetical protein n=1 Tax=Methylocapsa aurea TaxID=663610 RepID=UPI00055C97C6|nr:hypothetical protein [Methylocapsa aurea]
MNTLFVLATETGKIGPLDGPFTLSANEGGGAGRDDADLLNIVVGFVRMVAAGVSSYNKTAIEDSSNLKSYAGECFDELKSEEPEAAARLENLTFDCRRLPPIVKGHPIWKLDRAILRTLPGAAFVD